MTIETGFALGIFLILALIGLAIFNELARPTRSGTKGEKRKQSFITQIIALIRGSR